MLVRVSTWLSLHKFCFTYMFGIKMEQAIAKDSVLSRSKIISEPWDCGGLYLVGKFPNWDR